MRRGGRPNPWTSEARAKLKTLIRRKRLTVTLTAAEGILGIDRSSICIHIRSIGVDPFEPRRFWTHRKLRALKRYVSGEGRLLVSPSWIAKHLGCDRKSISRGISLLTRRERPRSFRWTFRKLAQLRRYIDAAGQLRAERHLIAAHLGCTEKSLARALKRLNVVTGAFTWAADKEALLASLRDKDGTLQVTINEAAEKLGCSPRTVDYKLAVLRRS